MKRGVVGAAAACALAVAAVLPGCRPSGSSESAKRLFAAQCASCHGADGKGVPARRGLEPRLDLTRSTLVANRDEGLLFQRVAFGYGTMPGFSHRLSQSDLELVVQYVLLLAPSDPAP